MAEEVPAQGDRDDDAEFTSALPSDPCAGPRNQSRVVVRRPASLAELLNGLLSAPTSWIWRGQASFSWRLEPRLAREFRRLPPLDDPSSSYDFLGLENRTIGFFKERARRSLSPPPDDIDVLGWLALMQHYQAPTRLLDWSTSPFVALWFACDEPDRDDDASLWAINAYLCRREITGSLFPMGWDHLGVIGHSTTDASGETTTRYPALQTRQRDHENEFIRWAIRANCRWPLPVIPFDTDVRMTAQQTVLTCIGDLTRPVDENLIAYDEWSGDTGGEPPPGGYRVGTNSGIWPLREPADLIVKLSLPREWQGDALAALGTMGIDASTVFPGLDGIGRESARYLLAGRGSLREVITDAFSL
jgi:FRG domain-containing protein